MAIVKHAKVVVKEEKNITASTHKFLNNEFQICQNQYFYRWNPSHILSQLFADELAAYVPLSSFSNDIVTKSYFDGIVTKFRLLVSRLVGIVGFDIQMLSRFG